ncbi:MAG: TolC family protein, partial [Planctomycetia bacterium]
MTERTNPSTVRWMRRASTAAGVVALLGAAGCTQPQVLTKSDYIYYNAISADYAKQQYSAGDAESVPIVDPRTVLKPAAEPWRLPLEQALKMALDGNKQIALLGYQPGEAATRIDLQLSTFDTFVEAGGVWSRQERQVTNNIQTFGTGSNVLVQDLFGPQAGNGVNATTGGATGDQLTSLPSVDVFALQKRNATGGLTRFSYSIDYQNNFPVNQFIAINPGWRSVATIALEQPLLQGAGVEFNRSPLLIARANQEQSIQEFAATVNTLLRDVTVSYWQLYFTYQDLYSRETGMKQALAAWQKEKNKFDAGTGSTPDVAQAREQFEFFKAAYVQAMQRVHTAERELRELLGVAPEDGRQLIPADDPTVAAFQPDWQLGVRESIDNRPELIGQRFAIRAAEIEWQRQKNGLLPDLTASASYGISGLDNQFDQSLDQMTDNNFNEWRLAIRYRRQIGER